MESLNALVSHLPDLRGWGSVITGVFIFASCVLGFGKLAAVLIQIRDARQNQLDTQFGEQIKRLEEQAKALRDENRLQRREMLNDRSRADTRYNRCETENEGLRGRLSHAFERIDGLRRELTQRDLSLAEAIRRAEQTGTFDYQALTYQAQEVETTPKPAPAKRTRKSK